jgi:hypothetical protein
MNMNPSAIPPSDIERFVRASWTSLAAAAWRHFLAHGRGAMLVDGRIVEQWRDNLVASMEPAYTTVSREPTLQKLIQTYDPEKEVLIAFLSDHATGAILVSGQFALDPPPPTAHRARGD